MRLSHALCKRRGVLSPPPLLVVLVSLPGAAFLLFAFGLLQLSDKVQSFKTQKNDRKGENEKLSKAKIIESKKRIQEKK